MGKVAPPHPEQWNSGRRERPGDSGVCVAAWKRGVVGDGVFETGFDLQCLRFWQFHLWYENAMTTFQIMDFALARMGAGGRGIREQCAFKALETGLEPAISSLGGRRLIH